MQIKQKSLFIFIIYLVAGLAARGLMLYYKFPSYLYQTNLFNSNNFAISNISPSLGDFLINSFFGFVVVLFIFFRYAENSFQRYNNKVVNLLAILLSFFSLYFFIVTVQEIYTGSQYLIELQLNATEIGIEFKLASLAIFIFQAGIYLVVQYYCFLKIKQRLLDKSVALFSIAFVIILGLLCAYFQLIPIYLLLGHFLYFLVIYIFNLNVSITKYHYKATIFLVLSSIFCSFLGTYIHHTQEEVSDYAKKQQFAKSKLEENDPMSEFLIEIANENIKNSQQIKSLLAQNPINFDLVDEEIKRKHLKNWFDKYEININYYGIGGENLKNGQSKLLEGQWAFYVENGKKTLIENLYLIASGQLDNAKKYVYRTKIEANNHLSFDVIIVFNAIREFKIGSNLSRISSNNKSDFNYIIFTKKRKISSGNNVDSATISFEEKLLAQENIFDKILIANDIAYTALKSSTGKTILVYSSVSAKADLFRVFSFLFILLILVFISGLIFVSYFFGGNNFNKSYAAKIQIYFGLAFLIPLFFTLFIVFNLIRNSHFKSEIKRYEKIAVDIKAQILQSNLKNKLSAKYKYEWTDLIHKLANDFDVNVNLYSTNGIIISKAMIFDNNNNENSDKINESMVNRIFQAKNNESVIEKSISNPDSYVLYKPFSSNHDAAVGFLSIEFYPTNSFENNETNVLFGSILSTFVVIFLLFLIASIIISNRLVKPLGLITNYLQNTDLKNSNQPIEMKANDEIGLLVEGYNNMLHKIEEGKKEISASEKQIAWLDIAKQVAHEIKNPLTPMKLTLQHLENSLSREGDFDKNRILTKISSLLYNIDSISEIVDSFMAFAKMPMPKNVKVDFLKPINLAFELYTNTEGVRLSIDRNIKKAYILGDKKLLIKIINNLIINALQSISVDRKPLVFGQFEKNGSKYLLKISDNGIGIADELRKKVFLPNFTTKSDGLGIGLSLAKWGIENMNGEIWFETTVGEGSTFFIELPAAKN